MTKSPHAGDYIHEKAESVSQYLDTLFTTSTQPSVLFEAMNYSLLGAGKRLRPVLCIAAAEAFGVDAATVMPAAAALELVHCYSLIHDDLPVMDNDDLRRGRPTNHIVFGDATALLAGDALLTYAFEQLSKPLGTTAERQLEMIRVLSNAAGAYGMVGGQQADMLAERNESGDIDTLRYIHLHKTAKLIQASVVIGSLFADMPKGTRDALAFYGESIGLAFQMVDDWLDVAGSQEEIGKPVGSDERHNKLTYPRLIGLDATRKLASETLEKGCNVLDETGVYAPILKEIGQFIVNRSR